MGLNLRCFRGYNGFRENYSTKISNAHKRAPILSGRANGTSRFIKNFVDSYPQNLSPTKFKSYTVILLHNEQTIHVHIDIYLREFRNKFSSVFPIPTFMSSLREPSASRKVMMS